MLYTVLHCDLKKLSPLFLQYLSSLLTNFNVLLPLQSQMISAHYSKIYHLTLIALSHYRVNCKQMQFFKWNISLLRLFSHNEDDVTVICY